MKARSPNPSAPNDRLGSVAVKTALGLAMALRLMIDSVGAAAQTEPPAAAPPVFPKPDRPVAGVVSPSWGEAAARDRADEIGQITRRLGLRAGMTVADIGAGDGYDSVRLSRILGPTGRVLAEDVTPGYLVVLRKTVRDRRLENITVTLGEPGDPHLPPSSVDAVIMVHMYHEIRDPYGLLYHLAPALKPGGRVGVEELDRPTYAHGTPPALLTCEFKAAGYQEIGLAPLEGGLGYFAIFSAPESKARPQPGAVRPCHG